MKTNILSQNLSKKALLVLAGGLLTIASCKQKEPVAPVEEELITTVRLTLSNAAGSQTYIYKVQNGFNQTNPGLVQADTLRLKADSSYSSSLTVLNESVSPAADVTPEIVQEKDEHLFLYVSDPAAGAGAVSFSGGDLDNAGKPFNLNGRLKAGGAGRGTLRVYLKHQPTNKNATNPADAGPDTDAEAVFPVRIQ